MRILSHLAALGLAVPVAAGPIPLAFGMAAVTAAGVPWQMAHFALVAVTVWCIVQTAVALLLLIAGHFSLWPAIAVEIAVFVFGTAVTRRIARFSPVLPNGRIEWALLAGTGVVGIVTLLRALRTPTTNVDSLLYHLPALAVWYQAGRLMPLDGFGYMAFYPFGWEVMSGLWLLPLGDDFLVGAAGMVAWGTFGLGIYLTARALGAIASYAMMAALLACTMRLVLAHVGTLHVDLPLAAFFMAGTYAALAWGANPSIPMATVLLAAAAMCAGVKTSGIAYAILILVAAGALAIGPRSERRPRRPAPTAIIAALMGASLLVGVFWYARNIALHGGIAGPLALTGPTVGSMAGPVAVVDTTLLRVFDPTAARDWTIFTNQVRLHLGMRFFLLTALAAAAFGRRDGGIPGRRRIAMVGLLAATALLYAANPFSGGSGASHDRITTWVGPQLRFALPFVGLVAATAAASVRTLRGTGWAAAIVLILTAASTEEKLLPYAAIALATVTLVVWPTRRWVRPTATAALMALVVGGTFALRMHRDRERVHAYGTAFSYVDTLEGAPRIGHLLTQRSYILYGRRLRHDVTPAPAARGGKADWLNQLRERGIDIIAVGPLVPAWRGRRELAWLAERDGPFQRLVGNDPERETVLYAFRDSPYARLR